MLRRTAPALRGLVGFLCLGMLLLPGFAEEVAKKETAGAPVVLKTTPVPSLKKSPYKHPSFIAGVTLLSAGLALGVTAGILWSFNGKANGLDCVLDYHTVPCGYNTRTSSSVFGAVSIGALAGGAASMIYWGVTVNIP